MIEGQRGHAITHLPARRWIEASIPLQLQHRSMQLMGSLEHPFEIRIQGHPALLLRAWSPIQFF